MPTIKVPDIRGDDMIVTINRRPLTAKEHKELLTKVTLLSALRDRGLARQGIRFETPESFGEETITVTGLQVAAYLAERFKDLAATPKMWQKRVRFYEKNTAEQLQQLRQDLDEAIKTLEHTEALQEVNRAYAYLQKYYERPQGRLHEGELSGLANPDQTVPVVPADAHGQCPAGYMWSARVGGCVQIPDGAASTAFDTTPGGNRASSDLRKARAGTSRTQFTPEGTKVALGKEAGPDDSATANRAMGNPEGCEVSDKNIDTAEMPGGSKANDLASRARRREGELSGMSNPDKEIEVTPADANGQCRPSWIYSARLGGCIRLADGTASTGFDTTKDGNTAASDLRKPRGITGRTKFTPEGTETVAGSTPGRDNSNEPNPAMGNVKSITQMIEGELSGMANPDQILRGVDPDSKGQCPQGYFFSAMVGKCIQLSVDQQADALRKSRSQHIPEGTVTRMGRTYGHDNSDEANPAMGFLGPLAMLDDEGWFSLSNHYALCMFTLKNEGYSYYASKHASERYCFIPFEGRYDGFINGRSEMAHAAPFHLTKHDEDALAMWQKLEEVDFNKKTALDAAYEQQMQQRLQYRPALTDLINRKCSDETIQLVLEKNAHLPRETVRSLMTDVRILRSIKPPPRPNIRVKWTSDSRGEG